MNLRLLNKLSIQQKIIAVSLVTTGIVLVFAAVAMMTNNYANERGAIVNSTAMLANVIGLNTGAALAFQDPDAAAEVLSALEAQRDIVAASIYSANGETFAAYTSTNPKHRSLLQQLLSDEQLLRQERLDVINLPTYSASFRPLYLDLTAPIKVGDQALAVINLQVDLGPLMTGVYQLGVITLFFLLLTFPLTYMLSSRLQRSITNPIKRLSKTMMDVSEHGDYSHRIENVATDEIGTLGSSFNEMLEQIQSRDQQLEKLVKQLKAATKAKSSFLANMSHEIRTPMNGILGITELLLDAPMTNKQKLYFETIEKSAQSLLAIINDILDISKIETGLFQIDNLEFDLTEVIKDIHTTFQPSAQAKQLVFSTNIAQGVPAEVLGDAGRLRQVLTNLIGNAIKFTSNGSVTVAVSAVSKDAFSTELLCEVTDTGIGIAESAKDSIFSEFTQADESTTRQFGGTGLGLSVSKHLVELMQGKIGVDGTNSGGSRFWFVLPMELKNQSPENFLDRPLKITAPSFSSDIDEDQVYISEPAKAGKEQFRAKVLIADDNVLNQYILIEGLKKFGLEVLAVNSGTTAIEAIKKEHFDLVVMDIQMPGMDGMEATEKIRSLEQARGLNQPVPIVAFSANAMEGDRERFLNAGMDDYLSKPLQTNLLEKLLLKWLAHLLVKSL